MSKPYRRPMSKLWWLRRRPYTAFMLREISSVFIGAYVVLLLVLVWRVDAGPSAYAAYLDTLKSPGMLAFHAIAFVFALLHTITWFLLAPKALAVWRGQKRVPAPLIAGPHFLVWLLLSGGVAALFLA